MAHVISHGEFMEKRRQKLKASEQRTPDQLVSEVILQNEGYKFERVTPAGSLLYTKRLPNAVNVALIDPDGAITRNTWTNED